MDKNYKKWGDVKEGDYIFSFLPTRATIDSFQVNKVKDLDSICIIETIDHQNLYFNKNNCDWIWSGSNDIYGFNRIISTNYDKILSVIKQHYPKWCHKIKLAKIEYADKIISEKIKHKDLPTAKMINSLKNGDVIFKYDINSNILQKQIVKEESCGFGICNIETDFQNILIDETYIASISAHVHGLNNILISTHLSELCKNVKEEINDISANLMKISNNILK